jgi:hypothetical protein
MIIVRDHGQGGLWYIVAVHYPTALMARTAWEHAERKLIRGPGEEGIGVFRLKPNTDGGLELASGMGDRHGVVAVTLDESMAQRAERLLRNGRNWMPTEPFMDALISRRAHVVAANAGKGGRIVIRRPEGRGAHLSADGSMDEQAGGQG